MMFKKDYRTISMVVRTSTHLSGEIIKEMEGRTDGSNINRPTNQGVKSKEQKYIRCMENLLGHELEYNKNGGNNLIHSENYPILRSLQFFVIIVSPV